MLVQDTPTGAQSEPFTVFAEQDTVVNVVTYVDTLEPNFPVEVIVEKIWCEDDERAGETEFTLDSPPPGIIGGPGPLAAAEASTCYEEPPSGERGELTVSLNGVDTDFSDEQTIEFGSSVYFESVPVGTYTVTETVDLSVTSDEFTFTGPLHRVRIINYVAEDTDRPAPPAEGTGSLYGNVYFCSDPDRAEGDVDFIVRAGFVLQDVSTCEAGTATSGQVTLYRLDGPDGEIDPEQTESLYTYPDGTFEAYDIPTGYYRLGYSSPEIDEAAISEPFEIYGYDTRAEINVFTAPVASGHVDVYKDICVDPERAGEALFQVNEPFPAFIGIPQGEFQASASSSCRYATEADGPFTFTLTSVDTGETWTQEMEFDSVFFEGIPSGTYTLTETHDGTTHTSGEFEFEFELDIAGEFGSYEVFVRNFIAEGDFSLPEDQTDNATLEIYGYICTDPERDGEAEFFFYSEPQFLPAATAECRVPGAFDDLSFTAIQTDENGVPLDGATEINFAAGEREAGVYVPTDGLLSEGFYVVTEATTGVSTGVLTLEGDHYLDFLKYAALPRAEVIVYLSSADPSIADTLPDDASWTVSQGDTVLFTDTFAPEHRDLSTEQVIPVENPILYGTYTVTVDGGPDFEPYTAEFVVDEPIEDFFIELQPVQPTTPEPTPTTEPTPGETPTTTPVPGTPTPTPDGTPPAEETTTDVIVTVRTVDGGDIPDGTEVCLTSTDGDYDECLTLDEVAGQMVVAAVPSGTTISFSDVPAGTYALTVPANAPYLAYAETIEVADGEPYEVTVVLQLDDETPPATETPGTDDETPGPDEPDVTPETPDDDGDDSQDDADDSGTSEDADGSDDSDDESVTTLPDTGDGAGRDTISGVITLLLLASALALMAASTLARGSGRTGST